MKEIDMFLRGEEVSDLMDFQDCLWTLGELYSKFPGILLLKGSLNLVSTVLALSHSP